MKNCNYQPQHISD